MLFSADKKENVNQFKAGGGGGGGEIKKKKILFLSFFQRISIQQNKSHTHTKKQNPKKQTKNPRQHNSGLLSQTEVKTLKY